MRFLWYDHETEQNQMEMVSVKICIGIDVAKFTQINQ